ncbi:MAG: hypothetical protein KF858_09095 [Candidatus Sumerlaeia bacterium]|nr:hypothetical protein [Candidatus Sumerlaeia bacterium]
MDQLQYLAIGYRAVAWQRFEQEYGMPPLAPSERDILLARRRRAESPSTPSPAPVPQRRNPFRGLLALFFPPELAGSPYPET